MTAAVGGRRHALDEAARLEPVQKARKPRALDPKEGCKLGLREPAIGSDHDQHRELRRADVDAGQFADQILENPDLQPPHEITEMGVEDIER